MKFLKQKLDTLEKNGLLRNLSIHAHTIDFSSNDYLGLGRSVLFGQAFSKELNTERAAGSTGSRLLTGNTLEIEALEEKIARFHKAESALIFPSGYQANVGFLSSIAGRGDTVIRDEFCHASIIDGLRLGFANTLKFKHNNCTDLDAKLSKASGEKFVIIEGLYSMDGDIPDLQAVAELCENHGAHLIVDEAHTCGLYGNGGEGIVAESGLESQVFARIMTYGKAFAYQGGAIIGSQELRQYLINKSRAFIYSTGINYSQVLGLSVAYDLIEKADKERNQLKENIRYFRQAIQEDASDWIDSYSQIQGVRIPGNSAVMEKSVALKDADILALPIRNPTVAEGEERIRICLHAYNTKSEMDGLINILGR